LSENQRGESLVTSIPIADLSLSPTATSLNFPQGADGGGYQTTLLLLNTSDAEESGTIDFWRNDGTPLKVSLEDSSATVAQASYQIPAVAQCVWLPAAYPRT
jgi:hypothetical protein